MKIGLMKKQRILICLSLGTIISSPQVWSQNNFLSQNYSLLNPAATGINNAFEISTTGFLTGRTVLGTELNAGLRIKKMHGAIGIINKSLTLPNFYAANSSRLNYSFHHQLSENSLLGIGAGIGVAVNYFENNSFYPNGIVAYTGTFGAHYKWKNLQVGIANTFMTNPDFNRVQLSSIAYADYTWEINPIWKLNFSIIENLNNHQFNLGVRATVHDKFWFGINRENNLFGSQIGYHFTKQFSVGYALNVNYSSNELLQSSRITNTLNLKFTIPNK
jgi:Type IX secretion system membrane protein PorP/SprF